MENKARSFSASFRLLKEGKKIADAFSLENKLERIPVTTTNNILAGVQIYAGQVYESDPSWLGLISEITVESLKLKNKGAAVVIFIPIGERCFEACKGLVSNVVVPDSVKTIGAFAFVDCTGMTNIKLSANLESILDSTFNGCTFLSEIEIPANVKSIGDSAFKDCSRLKTIKLPDTLETIGANAFNGCKNVSQITVPDSVKSIGEYAFESCRNLKKIRLSGNTELTIGDYIFGEDIEKSCRKLEEIYVAPGSKAETWCKDNGLADMVLDVAGYQE